MFVSMLKEPLPNPNPNPYLTPTPTPNPNPTPYVGPGMFVSMLKESMPPGSKGHTYCCGKSVIKG